MDDEPKTEELRIEQARKEATERELADASEDDTDTHTHVRRADKAAYLRAKLDEQADSERDA